MNFKKHTTLRLNRQVYAYNQTLYNNMVRKARPLQIIKHSYMKYNAMGFNSKENHLDVKSDIMIYAAYPKDYRFLDTIKKLLSFNFKKLFFIYSKNSFTQNNWDKIYETLNHPNIDIIEITNIGYDFKKYYEGLSRIKESGESYNKVWLMNDSFSINNWPLFIHRYNIQKSTDLLSPFISLEGKAHAQSYLLIMKESVADYYIEYFKKYKFFPIDTKDSKFKIISELEINLSNSIINNKQYKVASIFLRPPNELVPPFPPNGKGHPRYNPTLVVGKLCGILKHDSYN